jgi:hypothetical protein
MPSRVNKQRANRVFAIVIYSNVIAPCPFSVLFVKVSKCFQLIVLLNFPIHDQSIFIYITNVQNANFRITSNVIDAEHSIITLSSRVSQLQFDKMLLHLPFDLKHFEMILSDHFVNLSNSR